METTMRGRLGTPAFCLLLGVLCFAASSIGGEPGVGLAMFAVMAIYAALLGVFGGRIETIGVLGGRPADERLATMSIHATAVAGTVALLVAITGLSVFDRARGERAGLRSGGSGRWPGLYRCPDVVALARLTEPDRRPMRSFRLEVARPWAHAGLVDFFR
jgi:hypothetical protein